MKEMTIGDIINVLVTAVEQYGAFVRVGEYSGMIHISDLSRRLLSDARIYVCPGEQLPAVVTDFCQRNGEKMLRLSHKACIPDPWSEDTAETVGAAVEGTVTMVRPYGAFVRFGGRVGLIHRSQMRWEDRHPNPEDIVSPGETVRAMIIGVDDVKGWISLSMIGLVPDPFASGELDHLVGMDFNAVISRITRFGIEADITDSLRGLIHISELSWSRVPDPSEYGTPGDIIPVRVIAVDRERHRICLSHRVLVPDPWENILKRVTLGKEYDGVVVGKRKKQGLLVRIVPEVDGCLKDDLLTETVAIGDRLKVRVVSIDQKRHRLILES